MDILLTDTEVRVLGCLMEKEMATPDYYPLSMNALTNACNQKSNRNPVVHYDEKTVESALAELKMKGLVWQSESTRVSRYGENFIKNNNLISKEAALLCLLFLRGPQTLGELRGRSERLYRFEDLTVVRATIDTLEEIGFVRKMARRSGHKESRYAHLLAGDVEVESTEVVVANHVRPGAEVTSGNEKLAEMEAELQALKNEFDNFKKEFLDFKKQFE